MRNPSVLLAGRYELSWHLGVPQRRSRYTIISVRVGISFTNLIRSGSPATWIHPLPQLLRSLGLLPPLLFMDLYVLVKHTLCSLLFLPSSKGHHPFLLEGTNHHF